MLTLDDENIVHESEEHGFEFLDPEEISKFNDPEEISKIVVGDIVKDLDNMLGYYHIPY